MLIFSWKDKRQFLQTASCMAQVWCLQLLNNICHSFSHIFFAVNKIKVWSLSPPATLMTMGVFYLLMFFRMETLFYVFIHPGAFYCIIVQETKIILDAWAIILHLPMSVWGSEDLHMIFLKSTLASHHLKNVIKYREVNYFLSWNNAWTHFVLYPCFLCLRGTREVQSGTNRGPFCSEVNTSFKHDTINLHS